MGTLVPQGAKLFIYKVWLADSAALIGEGYRTSTETEDHNLYYLGIVASTPSGAEFGPTFTHYNLGNETVHTFHVSYNKPHSFDGKYYEGESHEKRCFKNHISLQNIYIHPSIHSSYSHW